ncbi:MAG: WD40/YVTN/BNR-like repeat-containing protein, partial [Vulcanimicrobiaceae bacterium]
MTRRFLPAALCVAAFIVCALPGARAGAAPAAASPAPAAKAAPKPTPSPTPGPPFGNMQWRSIGPAASGGRVAAVAGSATDPNLYYLGAAGGGVWKTVNGGQTWTPVFAKEPVAAIGAVTIDPTNNNVVWVGTGESNPRNDVSYGDGVYKSTDGGKTWTNVGLKATRYISRILVDPKDPKHVIVGALGDIFKNSTHRGVYVTFDG